MDEVSMNEDILPGMTLYRLKTLAGIENFLMTKKSHCK